MLQYYFEDTDVGWANKSTHFLRHQIDDTVYDIHDKNEMVFTELFCKFLTITIFRYTIVHKLVSVMLYL